MKKEKVSAKAHIVYRTEDGKRVPGTTTITGILDKPALKFWANNLGLQGIDVRKYTDKLADAGTLAHYRALNVELGGEKENLDAYAKELIDLSDNSLLSFYEWQAKQGEIIPISIEEPFVSETYRYGGSIDFYGAINGVPTLLDVKTSKGLYPEMICQLAAYENLLLEHMFPVEKVMILRIGRDESEGFEEFAISNLTPYWEIFKHLRQVYDLRKTVKW